MSKTNVKHVQNGTRYELNGFSHISIRGAPKSRGKAYGELMHDDLRNVKRIIEYVVYDSFGVKWDFFIRAHQKYFAPKIKDKFPEFYEELEGIAEGSKMPLDFILAWNEYMTLTENWWSNMPDDEMMEVYGTTTKSSGASKEGGGQQDRCTGFIAVGDWTSDGKIVVAHNNFSNFIDGQLARYVIDITPTNGCRFIMMGFPGWIWSGTDFFVTANGIIGTETTIGGFNAYKNEAENMPISFRIRQCMQYGKTLDDYEKMILDGNSGDYANSWLFGDTKTNEIMRIELGLRFHNTERTKNGFFIGFNAPYDPRIRNLESANTGFDDIRRHQGARRVRLGALMKEHKGKLDTEIAKAILADHYDVYLHKTNMCSRTCCSHYEMDAREYMSDPSRPKPFQPRGAVDGNVCDTNMAKRMTMCLRWGNSCGTPFDKNKFCDQHMEWDFLREYLEDRPQQPWTEFTCAKVGSDGEKEVGSKHKITPRPRRKRGGMHTKTYKANT